MENNIEAEQLSKKIMLGLQIAAKKAMEDAKKTICPLQLAPMERWSSYILKARNNHY